MTIIIPDSTPAPIKETWEVIGEIHRKLPADWTVVGGQMVQFHAWRTRTPPTRATTDLDIGLAVRQNPNIFPLVTTILEEAGFVPIQHDSGIEYRWVKQSITSPTAKLQIDILLPTSLGAHSKTSVNYKQGIESHGIEWATQMSTQWKMACGDKQLTANVPTLMGAILAKSSALDNSGDSYKQRHLDDVAFLSDIATNDDLLVPLTPRQADRINRTLRQIPSSDGIRRLQMALTRNNAGSREP